MKKALYLLLVLFCLTACHSARTIPGNPLVKIEYGGGGGFTGLVTTNTLMADGTLVKPHEAPRQVAPTQMDTIASMAGRVTTSYVRPSNTYVFVNICRQNDTIRCAWAFGDKDVDRNVQLLYLKLAGL